jgi:hypothetical protein
MITHKIKITMFYGDRQMIDWMSHKYSPVVHMICQERKCCLHLMRCPLEPHYLRLHVNSVINVTLQPSLEFGPSL